MPSRGEIIGCCDIRATNYSSSANACCADCCIIPPPSGSNITIFPTALYPRSGTSPRPTTPGDWKLYRMTVNLRGFCLKPTVGGRPSQMTKYIIEVPITRPGAQPGNLSNNIWAKPDPMTSNKLIIIVPSPCNTFNIPRSAATIVPPPPPPPPPPNGGSGNGNGNGNGNGSANGNGDTTIYSGDDQLRMAGFNLGKYGNYIILGIVILGILWYTGFLKKLKPR